MEVKGRQSGQGGEGVSGHSLQSIDRDVQVRYLVIGLVEHRRRNSSYFVVSEKKKQTNKYINLDVDS